MENGIYKLPELNYDYESLVPHISKDVMFLHHAKHHQTYVDKLNATMAREEAPKNLTIDELIRGVDNLPDSIRQAVINFGGGHYNHSLFWECMTPNSSLQPSGELAEAINQKYGSFQQFVDEFTAKSLSVFGSGWSWLMPDLTITTSANQDNPMMHGASDPILTLDVWEHAYYLDFKNKRDDYVKTWWNVVDWDFVAGKYKSAK